MKTDEIDNSSQTTDIRRNSSMNGTLRILLVTGGIIIVLIVAAFLMYHRNAKMNINMLKTENLNLSDVLHNRDSVINDYMASLNQIEDNINTIVKNENIINLELKNKEFSKDKKNKIIEGIKVLDYLIDKNKKQISELNARLYHSGLKISQFEKKLAELNTLVEEKDKNISELKQSLSSKDIVIAGLNQKVDTMNEAIKQQKLFIDNQTDQMNKAYLIAGTYKQLKTKGVITTSGGFLGIGQSQVINSNIPENSFKPVDIRETKSISVSAKKAEFITRHPKDSYQLIKKNNKIQSIEITNPDKFWKYTKYAVLETK
jgi:uncharacterized coiled-coil protein SlyX